MAPSSSAEDIFEGAAQYYARYRRPYPPELFQDIVSRFKLDGRGRLLDLGCGPGTMTLPLAPHFESVVALDINAEMVAEGERLAREQGIDNITWRTMPAEDISRDMGTFRLVTCGSSFHWMDRDLVLDRVTELLEPDGGVAMAGGGNPWWDGPEDWHQVVTRVIQRYLGEARRVGKSSTWQSSVLQERFQQTLRRNGWLVEIEKPYEMSYEWDIDSVLGHLWSTSFGARYHFGNRIGDFERDLRAELAALGRSVFVETGEAGLVIGRPPVDRPAG